MSKAHITAFFSMLRDYNIIARLLTDYSIIAEEFIERNVWHKKKFKISLDATDK